MSRRAATGLGAALAAVVTTVLAGGGSPLSGCDNCYYPCLLQFDVLGFCDAPTSTCLLGGMPPAYCVPGTCLPELGLLPSGQTLTIPVGSMWSTLGPRDDLHVEDFTGQCLPGDGGQDGPVVCGPDGSVACTGRGLGGTITILFDGAPAQGCACTQHGISCENVPHSVRTIAVRFDQDAPTPSGGTQAVSLSWGSIVFEDDECEATHRICEG